MCNGVWAMTCESSWFILRRRLAETPSSSVLEWRSKKQDDPIFHSIVLQFCLPGEAVVIPIAQIACTVPMGLPPRMASSLKSWRSFISRISCRGLIVSTLWAALQGSPALSLLYTVYTVYVNLCVYDVSLCMCGGYFAEVIAIHKVLPETRLQLREGVEATHSIAGLDLIPYNILVIFGSWVLGSSTLHKIHLPAHDLQ